MRFRSTGEVPRDFVCTGSYVAPVFLGLGPSSLVRLKGRAVVYGLLSGWLGCLVGRFCGGSG